MKRLIIFLIRKRLGMAKSTPFIFANQKSISYYWFEPTRLMKYENGRVAQSNVSLNWLLSDDCSIIPGSWMEVNICEHLNS